MSKIQIIPGFEVEPGNCSLRVVTLDFLKSRGFDPNLGYGFKKEQSDRYGGKKLKLHAVKETKFKGGSGEGRKFSFIFSPEGTKDTYRWNEYMFKQYWDAIDATAKTEPKAEKKQDICAKKIAFEDEFNTFKLKYEANLRAISREIADVRCENAKLKEKFDSLSISVSELSDMVEKINENCDEKFTSYDESIEDIAENINELRDELNTYLGETKSKKNNSDKLLKLMFLSNIGK